MSGLQNIDHSETLFSFELLVENIRLDKVSQVSDELAVGVRLLDFPTLLIYQPEQSRGGKHQQEEGAHRFNRGKCCFFKMNLSSLHTHLANTPLYTMVLDVKEEIPKLVGTSLISLNKVMKRIRQDVTDHGVSAPSSHGERGLVSVCNLRGEKIGSISLSYRLQSLGGSLLPNATQRTGIKSNIAHGGEEEQHSNTENKPAELLPLDSEHASSPKEDKADFSRNSETSHEEKHLQNEDKQGKSVCDMQTGENAESQTPQTMKENNFEEDLTLFCPPHLFYCNSAEERSKKEGGDRVFVDPNSQSFTFEDSEDENKSEGASSPTVAQRGKQDVKMSENKGTSGVTPNVLGEAIQQLPLLNALLVELSQLNGQSLQQPLSIHPNLAWIYRPASTEPSHRNTKSVRETRQGISPNSKLLHSPRNCSTPLDRRASLRGKDKQSYSTSPRKKLVFGTTKTFNLRLKQVSPSKVKTRECVGLIQNKTQSGMSKEKRKTKSSTRNSDPKTSSSLNENIETMIQNLSEDSSRKQPITIKEKGRHEKVQRKRDTHSPRNSEKASLPEKDSRLVHIPSVESDIFPPNKDESEHHSESNQSHSDTHRGNTASSGSRRQSSSKSSFSDSAGEEDEYADDFNSLEPSDAFSPDPLSSPEPSRSKTPKSPVHPISDSGSVGLCRRATLPVPVKAPSSPPKRALRGTHIIQPQTHALALSFSSDDDSDGDTSASLQTIFSRKQMLDSSRGERRSGADSLISWRGQRSESTRNSRAARGEFFAESVSSCDPQEAEEVEDELGTLDFRKEYQHISELVANKLPGYTISEVLCLPRMRHLSVYGSAAAACLELITEMSKHVFLTGPPGVGKTTLVQKACEALVSSGVGVEGFYTEEVREGGRRVGFDVVTVRGERGRLSRIRDVSAPSHGRREYTVGQYVVDLASFENVALPLFRNVGSAAEGGSRKVFVIDEIGKMELFSQSFIRAVRQTLESSSCTILGTIPVPKGKPLGLVEEVRGRRDVKVFTVSKENRNSLLQDVIAALEHCLKQTS